MRAPLVACRELVVDNDTFPNYYMFLDIKRNKF